MSFFVSTRKTPLCAKNTLPRLKGCAFAGFIEPVVASLKSDCPKQKWQKEWS
jgi:hypothetical protein